MSVLALTNLPTPRGQKKLPHSGTLSAPTMAACARCPAAPRTSTCGGRIGTNQATMPASTSSASRLARMNSFNAVGFKSIDARSSPCSSTRSSSYPPTRGIAEFRAAAGRLVRVGQPRHEEMLHCDPGARRRAEQEHLCGVPGLGPRLLSQLPAQRRLHRFIRILDTSTWRRLVRRLIRLRPLDQHNPILGVHQDRSSSTSTNCHRFLLLRLPVGVAFRRLVQAQDTEPNGLNVVRLECWQALSQVRGLACWPRAQLCRFVGEPA